MPQTPPSRPRLDAHGAVDLSSLARPATPQPGTPGGLPTAGPYVLDVGEASFGELVAASMHYPVVVLLWATWSELSMQVAAQLAAMADQDAGRWQLARIDAEANPQIAQAFQAQSVPSAVALLAGQPVPLFQGAPNQDQVRQVLDQVLDAAAANKITGRVPAAVPAADEQPAPPGPVDPEEPPLPPLHQAAYDALRSDDLPTARAAYVQALKENPRDAMARAGLAQVGLLERTQDVDAAAAFAAGTAHPDDIDAQLGLADLEMLDGHAAEAFGRLVELVRRTAGTDRDRVRVRLVDLFEVRGTDDEAVVAARRALASALY